MSEPELVSVVIPTYNSARYVRAAVESALAQTYKAREVIVVDDGSTDDTAAVLEPYRGAVRYICQVNSGPARARNRGVGESRGRYVAFLDADDTWLPDKLSCQVRCLAANPAAGVVHSDAYYLDELTGERSLRDVPRREFLGRCYRRFFHGSRVTLSTVVVRRECLEQIGGFDEQIRHASVEDYDLLLRLARRYPFEYVAEPLVVYRVHPSNATKNLARMVAGDLAVVEKALREDPALPGLVGAAQVRKRLSDLYYSLGYFAWEQEDLPLARRRFYRAMLTGHRPYRSARPLLATWVPSAVLRRLRSVGQRWRAG